MESPKEDIINFAQACTSVELMNLMEQYPYAVWLKSIYYTRFRNQAEGDLTDLLSLQLPDRKYFATQLNRMPTTIPVKVSSVQLRPLSNNEHSHQITRHQPMPKSVFKSWHEQRHGIVTTKKADEKAPLPKINKTAEQLAKESVNDESINFGTETLAKIYAKQGNISQAKRIYEHLALRFPEKRAYFATLISNLTPQ